VDYEKIAAAAVKAMTAADLHFPRCMAEALRLWEFPKHCP